MGVGCACEMCSVMCSGCSDGVSSYSSVESSLVHDDPHTTATNTILPSSNYEPTLACGVVQ